MIPLAKQSTIEIPGAKQSTKLKVKTEKSAVVFTLVVIQFLLTNSSKMLAMVFGIIKVFIGFHSYS